jgi:hypothetical protein
MSPRFHSECIGWWVDLHASGASLKRSTAILIKFGSASDSEKALAGLLIQIGSVVLCTFVSIIRDQLSFIDGQFALTVTHSLISWYLLWINLRSVYRWCYGRRKAAGSVWNTLGSFLILAMWLALDVLVWFRGRIIPGDDCGKISPRDYFFAVIIPALAGSSVGNFVWPPWTFCFVAYLIYVMRHIRQEGSPPKAAQKGFKRWLLRV